MGRTLHEYNEHIEDDEEGDGSTTSSDDERIIYFAGDVSEASVSTAIASLFGMSRKDSQRPVYLCIETYGGSMDSMFALYDAMNFVPCPVHTIALGKVMSAGVLILAAGHKGERLIAPHARIMTHPAWGYMEGNVFEIKHHLKEQERQEKLWIDAMARETGRPASEIEELNSSRFDQYLSPQDCIDRGIADRMLYQLPDVLVDAKAAKAVKKKRSQ